MPPKYPGSRAKSGFGGNVSIRIESRGLIETARRALQNCAVRFCGTGSHRAAASGIYPPICGEHCPRAKGGHFPAVTDPAKVGELLRALHGYLHVRPLRFGSERHNRIDIRAVSVDRENKTVTCQERGRSKEKQVAFDYLSRLVRKLAG